MADLIDRQAAIEAVEFGITYAKAFNMLTGEVKELFKEGNKALNEAAERLKALPSAQPEMIIYCKDCLFWKRDRISCEGYARCKTGEGGIRFRRENDFCSVARRRTDE